MPSGYRAPTTARRDEVADAVDAPGLRTAPIPRQRTRRRGRIRMFDEFHGYPAISPTAETAENSGTGHPAAHHHT
ncbi:hypothetical protein OOZ19_00835 [Saccharopolyspora sp. NFXS83]|uniref:hypothetical protein n=1 Tax=Saccharopolyspora sp. NFXS83 TaxID=2993560 RepID=UPI00224A598D|nr:hypothetical protein [Saccharopolyspora sp. NFXS83]MCX2728776.1 hypothetical protein [Saccharopolyspora sp. NFXS83]